MISYEPLYRLIRERKITMGELSEKVGYQARSLSSIFSRHQYISTTLLSKLCESLSCKPEDIFEFVSEKPDHKRVLFRTDWQYSSEDFVTVNWEKVLSDIKSQGYSESGLSKKMGKDHAYISMRKNRKYTKKTVIKEIADALGKTIEEYI